MPEPEAGHGFYPVFEKLSSGAGWGDAQMITFRELQGMLKVAHPGRQALARFTMPRRGQKYHFLQE